MNKKLLESFLNKCILGGTVEGAKISSTTDELNAAFTTEDKNCIGSIICKNAQIGEGEFVIGDLKKFKGMLGVLSDDITTKITLRNEKPFSLTMSDSASKATLIFSNPNKIVKTARLKDGLKTSAEFTLEPQHVTTFLKALNIVDDTEFVYFICEEETPKIAIGYNPEHATSNVMISPPSVLSNSFDPTGFPAKTIREALSANKDAETIKLEIDTRGYLRIFTSLENFPFIEYYFVNRS